MKSTTLEPVAKATTKPITKFDERCDRHIFGTWLGIRRLTRLPDQGFPDRASCQTVVSGFEREKGQQLVADYRAAEAIAIANDVPAQTAHIARLVHQGSVASTGSQVHREKAKLLKMDPDLFEEKQAELSRLRVEAVELVRPILTRLIKFHDEALTKYALEAEERLTAMGLAISNASVDEKGIRYVDYELHKDPIATGWHVRRELCRHKQITLDTGGSIGAVQWFCSDEERVPFAWQ